ncbi:MAG: hypothetical protein O7C59_01380 [Rickettsia endosymbiont of Ixodes persulcatus]|nr:hypothetical protein [Rickettsia endosymbiont of Ixodes persulcatus]MCZ6902125.1 hypothetical protein [Rickettsia endosymbiont of Ixodes persulcatus]MCZ6903447.1 hypothetical protein [Rickettsia endosymbiont of Ixodes persulcatus]MCZ6908418.1 hypothetical protein [Rickettsia endosymbiont of Ixodes persulcatus]MCZ6911020.1 hypothetical protein [Rickettsia endosymbiont of Ixodes persulcatus]
MHEVARRAWLGQIRNSSEEIMAQIQKNYNITKKEAYDMVVYNTPAEQEISRQLINAKIDRFYNEIKVERARNAKNAKKLN